ncbi:hypothetical protein ACQR2W_05415 [Clostridium perfringens]|nr:hypothetical protein [Clostridium perfringens]MDM0480307.1 hypothetical protein [Clostridium perfringens]
MNLLENGKDSLNKAVTKLNNLSKEFSFGNYEYDLKDIVINLHHSVETMFKYLIRQKNEYLLFSNCEKIFENDAFSRFKNVKPTEVKTIQFLDAVHRVIVLYDISIKLEDYNKIKALNDIRNSLTHYEREFSDNEIEHLIALTLPALLRIYESNIEGFESWAKINKIYTSINNITKDMKEWSIRQFFILKEKNEKALKIIETLDSNVDKKKDKFKNKKDSINYLECPCCKNKLFHAIGNYIVDSENIFFLGSCEYCEINIDKKDAQFLTLYYENYDEYKEGIKEELVDIMIDNLMFSEVEDNIINELIGYEDIFQRLRYKFGYAMDDLMRKLAEKYFEEKIYFFNDVVENIVEYEDAKISLDIKDLYEYFSGKNEFVMKLKNLINILNKIFTQFECGDELKRYLNREYLSYHQGIYIDFQQSEREVEIEMNISFDFDFIFRKINQVALE